MSLTSALGQENHPLRKYFEAQLPRSAAVKRSVVAELPIRRVRLPVAPGRTMTQWSLLGHAIDYRIRTSFVAPEVPHAVVQGASACPADLRALGIELADAYLDLLHAERPEERTRGWLLRPVAETRLAAICFAMAWFEQVFRDARRPAHGPLALGQEAPDLSDLLGQVPEYAVRDLDAQTRLAESALDPLRSRTEPSECVAGPTFIGSADVGGADADLQVGDMLLEIKAASRPQLLRPDVLWQLAGYYLLDYEDRRRIRSVGLYLTRIGWLRVWPAEDFLRALGARAGTSRIRHEVAHLLQHSTHDGGPTRDDD
jgi:hypothetical protein